MTTFVYIDYGPSPDIERELRYSLATLLIEFQGREPDVVVYTDKPALYERLHPRVRARDLRPDFARWSRDGLYKHRVKPNALVDALRTIDARCALIDTDTFVRPGFAGAFTRASEAGGVVMDHFERLDPYPASRGFTAELPRLGRYAYDPLTTRMYNSGLVAASRDRHAPMLEEAVALIDAWLDAGLDQFNIEQIAVSECFRLHGESIAEMKPLFAHYYRRSQKLYMHPRLEAWIAGHAEVKPTRPFLDPTPRRVRWARILDKFSGRGG